MPHGGAPIGGNGAQPWITGFKNPPPVFSGETTRHRKCLGQKTGVQPVQVPLGHTRAFLYRPLSAFGGAPPVPSLVPHRSPGTQTSGWIHALVTAAEGCRSEHARPPGPWGRTGCNSMRLRASDNTVGRPRRRAQVIATPPTPPRQTSAEPHGAANRPADHAMYERPVVPILRDSELQHQQQRL